MSLLPRRPTPEASQEDPGEGNRFWSKRVTPSPEGIFERLAVLLILGWEIASYPSLDGWGLFLLAAAAFVAVGLVISALRFIVSLAEWRCGDQGPRPQQPARGSTSPGTARRIRVPRVRERPEPGEPSTSRG